MGERKGYTIASIVRLGSLHFQILVKPEEALSYRLGRPMGLSRILVTDTIYTDAKKGMRASKEDLLKAFGTTDASQIAEVILKKGKLQITTEQRHRLIEEKRQRIITLITRNCIDPRTSRPIPRLRIEQALAATRYTIDPFMSAEEQMNGVVDAMRPVLPIRIASMAILIKVQPQYAAKVYGVAKSSGSIEGEEWKNDGSLVLRIKIPAGVYATFVDRVSKMTQGSVEIKELR